MEINGDRESSQKHTLFKSYNISHSDGSVIARGLVVGFLPDDRFERIDGDPTLIGATEDFCPEHGRLLG